MRKQTMNAARIALQMKRWAGATDAQIADATGWSRANTNRKINDALKGNGELTVEDIYRLARAFDVEPYVFFLPFEEAMQWLAEHRPNLEVTLDLRDPKTGPDQGLRGSWWIQPTGLIDLIAAPKSHESQGLVLACR